MTAKKVVVSIVGAVMLVFSLPASTGEIARFSVDMDSDGRTELISLATESKENDHGRSPLVLKVGSDTYRGEYFSAGGDLPEISFVRLDRASGRVQIQLMDPGPAFCRYLFFSYSKSKLHLLLTYKDKCSGGPSIGGGGTVATRHWMGFWSRIETYRLEKDGTVLVRATQKNYPVNEDATTVISFTAAQANCTSSAFQSGMKVKIRTFDSVKSRYLIESTDGRCGWVSDRAMTELFTGLAWAG